MNNFNEKANFLWSVADLIRDVFKRGKYQDVILPLTVLRRIDCVLEPTKAQVMEKYSQFKGKLENLDDLLCKASGYAFYNTSPYTFERLVNDPPNVASNLRHYINGFSDNMREVVEKFDFDNTLSKLDSAGLLYMVIEKFNTIDLHPDVVSNLEMGYIFEDLIRRFNEALNENPGEHFTPREVVELMVRLLLVQDQHQLERAGIVAKVYDPCCGTGGMLTTAKDMIESLNPKADVYLYGQEVNPETFAICKSDLYMKSRSGIEAENIKYGSTLSHDQHRGENFDYILANPPYGKDWKQDEKAVAAEAARGHAGRFGAGTPRISDGQLLFLQHMLSKMYPAEKDLSRVAIVMNGSPLFTGDAGSGESEIRRWILESDWLEAIIALPEQLFYNTGISTYIWVLSNRKAEHRRQQVQLIDASSFWNQMRKSLGNKRREIALEHMEEITRLFLNFEAGEHAKIFDRREFGYRKIRVDRPLRLNFHASPERIENLSQQSAFQSLASSRKKDAEEQAQEIAQGREQQQAITEMLYTLPNQVYMDRAAFLHDLKQAAKTANLKLSTPLEKAIIAALSEPDETAEICRDTKGNPEADPNLRDYENVPLLESIEDYFEREVRPYVPDAWIDTSYTDDLDGEVGKVGYEINFNRYFYQYQPPRPLNEIETDIRRLEKEIMAMLGDITS